MSHKTVRVMTFNGLEYATVIGVSPGRVTRHTFVFRSGRLVRQVRSRARTLPGRSS